MNSHEFDILEDKIARELIKVIGDTRGLWGRDAIVFDNPINEALFNLYMGQLGTGNNTLLYPFAGWDIESIDHILNRFKKRVFIDRSAYLPHRMYLSSEIKEFAKKYDLTLVNHNLNQGLPKRVILCKDTDGARIYDSREEGETILEEGSVDLLVIKGQFTRNFGKFHDDAKKALGDRALIAVRYRGMDRGDTPDDIVFSDPYILPRVIQHAMGLQAYTCPFDFKFSESVSKEIQQLTGKPVTHINQLSAWYFFKKTQTDIV